MEDSRTVRAVVSARRCRLRAAWRAACSKAEKHMLSAASSCQDPGLCAPPSAIVAFCVNYSTAWLHQ